MTPNVYRLRMIADRHLLLGTAPDTKLQRMCNKIEAMEDAICRERWAIRVLSDYLGLYGSTEQHILNEICSSIDEDNHHVIYANAGMTGEELRFALTQGEHVGVRYVHHTGLRSSKVKPKDPIAEPTDTLEGAEIDPELG